MKFYIIRSFKYKDKTYSRRDKYIEMPYEDGRTFVRRHKIMLSKQQEEVKNEVKNEVKDDKEISKKVEPSTEKPSGRDTSVRVRRRRSSS